VLGLLDRLGQVVASGQQVHDVGDAIAGLRDEVERELEVDALLLAVDGCPAEPQLYARECRDAPLLRARHAAAGGVVPVDPEQGEAAVLGGLLHDGGQESCDVDLCRGPVGRPGQPDRRCRRQVPSVDVDPAVGAHGHDSSTLPHA
jgi:hypothetical protein